jgi:gliding motility-associated-like protein
MKGLRLRILLLSACFIACNILSGQCDFTVDVTLTKESDCESNGVIQATLSGANVSNGIIQISDARYSIESVAAGGYSKIFDANGGTIQGVPPGTYIIKAEAFCTATNVRVIGPPSAPITVPGTYPGFDIQKIRVITSDMKSSLKCSPTGLIPFELGSGRTPYTIKIVEAPEPALVGNSYTHPSEGRFEIADLPAGAYKFEIFDACGYTVFLSPVVDGIEPEYLLKEIVPTPKCLSNGRLVLSLTNGAHPYRIVLTGFPPEYTGEDTIYVSAEGEYSISGLPEGIYDFKVEESCYSEEFHADIKEEDLSVELESSAASVPCQGNGEIRFKFVGGLPPYTIEPVSCPDNCPFTSQTVEETDIVIGGFLPGDYEFKISDKCNVELFLPSLTVDILDISVSSFDLKPASSCNSNDGSINVEIIGGAYPLKSAVLHNITTNTDVSYSSGSSFLLDGLSAGDYIFNIIDACDRPESVTFSIEKDQLAAFIGGAYPTFGCDDNAASGAVVVHIVQGGAPYTLTIDKEDHSYHDVLGPSYEMEYVFQNLAQGKYNVEVADACGDKVNLTVEIKKFEIEVPEYIPGSPLPADLYEQFFSPLDTPDTDCNKVFIRRIKDNNTDLNKYWTDRYMDFEVAFMPPGSAFPPAAEDWRDVDDYGEIIVLNVDYCDARKNGLKYDVYVRHKGMPPPLADCELLKDYDGIEFPPAASEAYISDVRCENFDITISNGNSIICLPYKIIITDTLNGNTTPSYEYSASSDMTITLPLGGYQIKLTDKDTDADCTWFIDTLMASVPPPTEAPYIEEYIGQSCDKYQVKFGFNYFCYPYSWIFREKSTQKLLGTGDINSQEQYDSPQTYRHQNNLLYGVYYEFCMVWQGDIMFCTDVYLEHRLPSTPYRMEQVSNYCLPDTTKGYIRMFRDGSESFEQGAVITYLSGPSPLKDTVYVVPLTADVQAYYPFSLVDSLSPEYVDIKEGVYTFSILDSCKILVTISFEYKKPWAELSYTTVGGCMGQDIFPHGSIYLGNEPVDSWFRIIETPDGVANIDDEIQAGGSLHITETGHYVLQISQSSGIYSCPYDTLGIDFVKQTLALDADATVTYVCDEASDGFIKVQQKGGIGPFTYELLDQGVSQGKNSTGRFNYGKYGESYQVRITDEGCNVAFPVVVYMLDLSQARLINYDKIVCVGEDIQLTCLSIGAYSGYNWTGPDGLLFSTEQNPRIPKATIADTGVYSITVQPDGCIKEISQDVHIDVVDPTPFTDTTIYYCVGDHAVPLDATPTAGNYLKWFNPNAVFVSEPPTPPTHSPDTIVYFMSQVNIIYGCEGEKSTYTVIIENLPDTVMAYAPPVCVGQYPVIIIPYTKENYSYTVFSKSGTFLETMEGSGDTIKIILPDPVFEPEIFFVETFNPNKCGSGDRTSVRTDVLNYLYLMPDKIPIYQRDKYYSYQLQSNAVAPYKYSTADIMPLGFNLSISGLIAGDPPRNGLIDPIPFLVKITDANGCVVEKEYVLESGIFFPQLFTPNGDGKNDIFMKGRRLVIFDRLGLKIYEGNDGWDGTRFDGTPAPPDTYFYLVYYEDENLLTEGRKKGYITLVRKKI